MKVETFQAMGAVPVKDGIVFSMERKNNEEASLLLYKKGSKEVIQEIPFPATNTIGDIVCVKAEKIASARYEYNFCIDGKVTLDPYAKVLIGTGKFGEEHPEGHEVRCAMIAGNYDWEDDRKPQIAYEDAVMYSFHVRGFTKQRYSGVRHKGTFLGITEKAEYFKELGINQIKLMPAYEFAEMESVKTHARYRKEEELPKRLNYWGYTKAFHFAPKRAYAATKDPVREFKDMVKTMHRLGIEVLMEFYFPEGCSPRYITECLQYWVQEYHVDGFHVRGVQGICNLMATDPLFADTKLLNIYFPVEEIYGKKNLPKKRMVAECNDGFMIDVRRFLKGDEESLKAFAERMRRNPKGSGLINYIASHDGFTLCDLVSYEERHNEDNGEQNHDGRVQNYSWNCGFEGRTKKKKVLALREKQMKNALMMLMFSAGTPLIFGGDEFLNSQLGNNNPYRLDNEITWVNWNDNEVSKRMTEFVKKLISFRKKYNILHMKDKLLASDSLSCGYPDISYHGSGAWYQVTENYNRHIGIMYCTKYSDCKTNAGKDDEFELIYIAYNMHWEAHELALPKISESSSWNVKICSADDESVSVTDNRTLHIAPRTSAVLTATIKNIKNIKRGHREYK